MFTRIVLVLALVGLVVSLTPPSFAAKRDANEMEHVQNAHSAKLLRMSPGDEVLRNVEESMVRRRWDEVINTVDPYIRDGTFDALGSSYAKSQILYLYGFAMVQKSEFPPYESGAFTYFKLAYEWAEGWPDYQVSLCHVMDKADGDLTDWMEHALTIPGQSPDAKASTLRLIADQATEEREEVALEAYHRALDVPDQSPDSIAKTWYHIGQSHWNYREAEPAHNAFIEAMLIPECPDILRQAMAATLSAIFDRLGRTDISIEYLEALEQLPYTGCVYGHNFLFEAHEFSHADHLHLGWWYLKKRKFQNAKTFFLSRIPMLSSSVMKKRTTLAVFQGLAEAYAELGQFDEAFCSLGMMRQQCTDEEWPDSQARARVHFLRDHFHKLKARKVGVQLAETFRLRQRDIHLRGSCREFYRVGNSY